MYFQFPARTHTVVRNGLTFQIPLSNHCSARFTVHPDGSGTGWDESSPDVDQPHGLDYRSHQDLRKGVRKRLNKEHVACGDNTAGGEHIPGGCAVVDVVDTTGDVTDGWGDGTYVGGGLVWCSAEQLWLCGTCDGTYDAVADVTLLKIHPDKQWGGQDITWTGGHEFDASVDVSGNVALDGDFSVDGTAALQDTVITGDSTFTFDAIAGETGPTFKIFGDWSARSNNTVYQARTDGLVHAFNTDGAQITGLTDESTPPTTVKVYDTGGAAVGNSGIQMAVKGSEYWKTTGADTVYWLPFGDNT